MALRCQGPVRVRLMQLAAARLCAAGRPVGYSCRLLGAAAAATHQHCLLREVHLRRSMLFQQRVPSLHLVITLSPTPHAAGSCNGGAVAEEQELHEV